MQPQRPFDRESESGLALLLALIALSLFSLIGLLVALDATSELRISDNHESHIRAENAARAGMSHARELLRGLLYDVLLEGPDGTHDGTAQYINLSKTFPFRNPMPWAVARSLDLSNPAAELGGLSDDGLLNTGLFGGAGGRHGPDSQNRRCAHVRWLGRNSLLPLFREGHRQQRRSIRIGG